MSAQITDAQMSRAQRNYDRELPREPREYDTCTSTPSPRATVQQLQDFIERLAEHGVIEDNLGEIKRPGELYQAIAIDWMDGKMRLPATTYLAFERWAMAACNEMLRAAR